MRPKKDNDRAVATSLFRLQTLTLRAAIVQSGYVPIRVGLSRNRGSIPGSGKRPKIFSRVQSGSTAPVVFHKAASFSGVRR